MIKIFLPCIALLFTVLTYVHAEEGGLIFYEGKCYVEFADGSEEETDCPNLRDVKQDLMLSDSVKQDSIDLLEKHETSPESDRLKAIALDISSKNKLKGDLVSQTSAEDRRKAKKIKNNKYLVELWFFSNPNYPKKSRNGPYYRSTLGQGTQLMDETFSSQWDEIIASELIGNNYAKYETMVVGVTQNNVIIHVLVKNSGQLKELIKNKDISYIDHIGSPLVEYEEIKPITFTSTE